MGGESAEAIGEVAILAKQEEECMKKKDAIEASVAEVARGARSNQLEVQKPSECALAMKMLARGSTYKEILGETGIGYQAISKLRVRHEDAIAVRRHQAADEAEQLTDTYREVLRRKADMLLGDEGALGKLNPKDAALTIGILTDKAASLRGEATAVVEHRKAISLEDAQAYIDSIKNKTQEESIDI
jgi:hypothetical protein